jgi:hypothetical protein
MKTEEIQRTPRSRDAYEVSRSLQELKPTCCSIVDRHRRPVPLSSAGYVLRFGRSYHLRLISPFTEEDIQEVRISTPPAFVNIEREMRDIDEQGRTVRSIPFKVSLDVWSFIRKLGMGIHGDELEVVHYFKPGVFREAPCFLCPIVARPRWGLVIWAVLLGLLLIVLEKLVVGAFSPDKSIEETLQPLLRWESWWRLILVALPIWLGVSLVNLGLLYRRSRELHNDFRAMYPA